MQKREEIYREADAELEAKKRAAIVEEDNVIDLDSFY